LSKFNKYGYLSTDFSKNPENKISHHSATGSRNATEKFKTLIHKMHLLQATLFQRKSVLIKNKQECNLEYNYLDKRVRPEALYYRLQFYKGISKSSQTESIMKNKLTVVIGNILPLLNLCNTMHLWCFSKHC
jgi:hypothetical protein